MDRDYAREYRRDISSIDFLRVRIPKDLKSKFFQKAASDGTTPSKWILDRIRQYVDPSE